MSMNLLITGGAGYIGSHTILELLAAGHSVVCVDNGSNSFIDPTTKYPESLKRVKELSGKEIPFYCVNVRDRPALDEVFKKHKIEAVIHFAAFKAVGESCKRPLDYFLNNIAGSANLFDTMVANEVFKIIFSSSATVYGDPQFLPFTEEHPTGNCTNPYGKTKYFTEEMLKDLCSADARWSAMSLRYFNPVGAHASGHIGEDPLAEEPHNLTPYISQVAIGKFKFLKVFGDDYATDDGTCIRDYTHVVDLAQGHVAALKKIHVKGFAAYNIGTGKGHTVLQMVKAFGKACGFEIPYQIAPRRDGDVVALVANTDKAEKELGWKAQKTLDEMYADAWNWQKKNPKGYRV